MRKDKDMNVAHINLDAAIRLTLLREQAAEDQKNRRPRPDAVTSAAIDNMGPEERAWLLFILERDAAVAREARKESKP